MKRHSDQRHSTHRIVLAALRVASLLLLGVSTVTMEAADTEAAAALFDAGNAAYSENRYTEALTHWEKALDETGLHSAALHYNLGNAYFQLERYGPAVLNFEKSLALDPGNAEARANLAFIRRSAELPVPESGPLESLANALSLRGWCWLAAIAFWVSVGFTVLPRFFSGSNTLTRLLSGVAAVVLLVAFCALIAYHGKSKEVVILAEGTPLLTAPTATSPETENLPAGSVARIEKRHDTFAFVRTTDGASGWLPDTAFGRIWD